MFSDFVYTVPFHSIRQGLWRVTALPKFWFQHPQRSPWIDQNFGSIGAAASEKILYLAGFDKRFRQPAKIAVTIVTFRRFESPRDAWLPNWTKWYSIFSQHWRGKWSFSRHNDIVFLCPDTATLHRIGFIAVTRPIARNELIIHASGVKLHKSVSISTMRVARTPTVQQLQVAMNEWCWWHSVTFFCRKSWAASWF
jgi:hypothetical protein